MRVPAGYTGHVRDLPKGQVVPDPKVKVGPFKILRRTDNLFVIHDPRLPFGASVDGGRTFVAVEGVGGARERAEQLAELEEKQPDAPKPYDWDREWFAGMKRALANGFAPHAPAYSREELLAQALEDGGRRA